jgi:multiple sugar transport system substrate-binding protein
MYTRSRLLSRRAAIKSLAGFAAIGLLAACGGGGAAATPAAAPTQAPAAPKPTSPAAVAAQPTTPPAPTTAPAAAAPTPTTAAAAAPTTAPVAAPTTAANAAPTTAPATSGQTTIKLVDWVSETIDSWANRHFKPFMDAHPEVKISHEQITGPGGQIIETVLTRLSAGNEIDIIGCAPDSTGSYLRSGAAQDLRSYIAKDARVVQTETFPAWTLEDYTIKRYPDLKVGPGQYGVPLVMFLWEFWHNTELYQQAGISVPQRGWTWDDFVIICKKLTDVKNKNFGYQNQNWLLPLWPWVWQNGGDALTPDGTKLAIGSPATIETFSFLQKLAVEDKVFPALEATAKEGGSINFDSGHTGMITRGNWNLDLSRDWKFKWDISYPPKGKQEATIGEEVGYIMNKGSAKKDAAWTFMSWTLSPEGRKCSAYEMWCRTCRSCSRWG